MVCWGRHARPPLVGAHTGVVARGDYGGRAEACAAGERSVTTIDEILASANPLSLALDFEGGCPCCHMLGDGWEIDVHCWRVNLGGCACEHSGIHVSGLPADVAKRVAEHIRDHSGWHTDYRIVVEE